MGYYGDPLNQRTAATIFVRGPEEWRGSSPSEAMVGIKVLIHGRQYGIVLDRQVAESLGIGITLGVGESRSFDADLSELVEGAIAPVRLYATKERP